MAIGAKGVRVYGVDRVLRNLNTEINKIKAVSKQRLFACGLLIKNRSLKYTPIKTGNLRGSCDVIPDETSRGPVVYISYGAYYAPYVHEMPESYNFTKPGTGPKFLERALVDEREKVLAYLSKRIV